MRVHKKVDATSVTKVAGDLTHESLTKQIDAIHRECALLKGKRTDLTLARLRGDSSAATQIDEIDINLFKAEREVGSLIELRNRLAKAAKHDWRKQLPYMIIGYKWRLDTSWHTSSTTLEHLLQSRNIQDLRLALDDIKAIQWQTARDAAGDGIHQSQFRTYEDVGKFRYGDLTAQNAAREQAINEAAKAILEAAPNQIPQRLAQLIEQAHLRIAEAAKSARGF
jgi:hypothetical protein